MNTKKIALTIGSVVVTFLFLFLVYTLTNKIADYKNITVIQPSDHVKWASKGEHVLVEYSDLQCPACKTFHELLNSFESSKSAYAKIPKNTTLIYRHFPLYQIHESAFDTAYAAEAAGKQGKFFPMLDIIFKDQENLSTTTNIKGDLLSKANELGLDKAKFERDIASKEVKDKVQSDLSQGEGANIGGTPSFFLDGKKLEFKTLEEFIQILEKL